MSEGLAGKVAVVTGASQGIGAATARLLAARGARVALIARRGDLLEKLALELVGAGGEALPIVCDLTHPGAIEGAFDKVHRRFGPVDVLVNNAAYLSVGPLVELSDEEWEKSWQINVSAVVHCTQRALTDMLERRAGVVVNVASVGGVAGVDKLPGTAAYAATKGAVIALSEALAAEVESQGVRVACVSPGATRTPMLEKVAPPDVVAGAMPPGAVAELIAFVASDRGVAIHKGNVLAWPIPSGEPAPEAF